ncbi:hypothetical protein LOK49_LG13G00453 [Camellia lanceoleosa]|uniref:Uncharacterized protein n=1 Tax=Camellia lanceoleosa TaxID=1840588 RepID=A0ACC0FG24_9ERIC|nr:hypothetical protein LOK49_LG13G00453 [Camellia lanceoleosa]
MVSTDEVENPVHNTRLPSVVPTRVTGDDKLEADSDNKNGSVEYVESVKESHGGRMSHDGRRFNSSSNSSSNDESNVVEENMVVIEYRESKDDALSSVARSDALRM